MTLPYFFVPQLEDRTIVLSEDTSKHMINVLRMTRGAEVLLTDGKGSRARAVISDDHRKKCVVEVVHKEVAPAPERKITIAISLVKNASRFEWFLEKATEIGVTGIIPLLCQRTEKEKFREERMQHILQSAMLQSQQSWIPELHAPTDFEDVIQMDGYGQKFIAHCEETHKQSLTALAQNTSTSQLMLIGPEGDFTKEEIDKALAKAFIPVTLGDTRLRTETAGMVAATILKNAVKRPSI